MKKNGFTLVELIATIAIMGILAVIITPAILAMRRNVLLNTLDGVIGRIETAAAEYGNDYINKIPNKDVDTTHQYVLDRSKSGCNTKTKSQHSSSGCDDYCWKVLVKTLIFQGYLVGDEDEKETLKNPITNESLNQEYVCIRFDVNSISKRKIVTYLIGRKDLENEA